MSTQSIQREYTNSRKFPPLEALDLRKPVNIEYQVRAALAREAKRMGAAATCKVRGGLAYNVEYQRHRWAALVLRDILNGEIG